MLLHSHLTEMAGRAKPAYGCRVTHICEGPPLESHSINNAASVCVAQSKPLALQDWLSSKGSQGHPQRDPHGAWAQALLSPEKNSTLDWGSDQQTGHQR